jgi:chromosome partitioning protein
VIKHVVTTQKGGVGKTTVVLHGVWYSAERRMKPTLVIDFDSQGNTSQTLKKYACESVTASRLFDPAPLPPIAPASAPETGEAIVLIAADRKLDDFGRGDAKIIVPALIKHLKALAPHFEAAWIDTPPSAGIASIAALIAGDVVVSPIDLETYSVSGVAETVRQVQGVQQRFNPRLQFLGILPSRVDGRSKDQTVALKELVTQFPDLVLPTSIRETEAIAAVPRMKVPVWRIPTSAGREHGRAMLKTFELIEARVAT